MVNFPNVHYSNFTRQYIPTRIITMYKPQMRLGNLGNLRVEIP